MHAIQMFNYPSPPHIHIRCTKTHGAASLAKSFSSACLSAACNIKLHKTSDVITDVIVVIVVSLRRLSLLCGHRCIPYFFSTFGQTVVEALITMFAG